MKRPAHVRTGSRRTAQCQHQADTARGICKCSHWRQQRRAPVEVACGAAIVRLVVPQQQRHEDAGDDNVAQAQHAAGWVMGLSSVLETESHVDSMKVLNATKMPGKAMSPSPSILQGRQTGRTNRSVKRCRCKAINVWDPDCGSSGRYLEQWLLGKRLGGLVAFAQGP